ncbi:hypothetical protein PPUN12996_39450 [Pseudomonas putida]|nr:hypothetical protein PPUN12996_39450 [Pseudomonas putida]
MQTRLLQVWITDQRRMVGLFITVPIFAYWKLGLLRSPFATQGRSYKGACFPVGAALCRERAAKRPPFTQNL